NGVVVVGATNQNFDFNFLEYGLYVVDVTDNGCTSTSLPFEYLITDVENFNNELKLYPNPVEKILTTEYNPPYIITIINTNGSIVNKTNSNTREAAIDLNSLASGIYFVQLKNEKGIHYKRITKK
ncbi:MAG TPA: T9SS type A sorting domain-containing protein, partial [Chryseolinea sp.]|nr:T9SS type A sorting domain-containing protein [Chryseolinea sp.]HPH46568.1 T9SS type A sorting domain-containing protein [Chryseolinea sp.]